MEDAVHTYVQVGVDTSPDDKRRAFIEVSMLQADGDSYGQIVWMDPVEGFWLGFAIFRKVIQALIPWGHSK